MIGVSLEQHPTLFQVMDFYRAHEVAREDAPQVQHYRTLGAAPLEPEWSVHMESTIRPSAEELQVRNMYMSRSISV